VGQAGALMGGTGGPLFGGAIAFDMTCAFPHEAVSAKPRDILFARGISRFFVRVVLSLRRLLNRLYLKQLLQRISESV